MRQNVFLTLGLALILGLPGAAAAAPKASLSTTPTLQAVGTPTVAPTPRPKKKTKKIKGKKALKKGKVKLKKRPGKGLKKAKKAKAVKLKIKGNGIVENNNAIPPLEFLTKGDLNAKAVGPGQVVPHAFFPKNITVYPAAGKLKATSLLASNTKIKLGSIQADVVCIANLGASNSVDGGGEPLNDIWELRVLVTKAKDDNGIPLDGPPPVGVYGSLFVQDNGAVDYADENFAAAGAGDPNCGVAPFFQVEPWLQGNLKIED